MRLKLGNAHFTLEKRPTPPQITRAFTRFENSFDIDIILCYINSCLLWLTTGDCVMAIKSTLPNENWMTIEELAGASKMTVRNIRAHVSRGTLPKPYMKGRQGFYDETHMDRLKDIAAMQNRGYSLAAIKDLLIHKTPEQIQAGALAALDGWKGGAPSEIGIEEFRRRYSFLLDREGLIQKAVDAGLLSFRGDRVEFPLPALAEVAVSLHEHGADEALLPFVELADRTSRRIQSVAKDVVETFVRVVVLKMESTNLSQIVATFRPLGLATISTLFGHAIENEIKALLKNGTDQENRNDD